jgi:RNA polymerase sigma-70 factor, ECF subfamily
MGAAASSASDRALLDAARRGDESAYRRLVERHRGELHAHCYRMLGSVHDAEDALQDTLLRAWKGLPRFAGRSSLRSWLYRIATNASLDLIGRRPRARVLPLDQGPATGEHAGLGMPLAETVWIEPYPDERLGVADGLASPEARYEQRESVELAFTAALQHLPARQRAVLILREVLGFSADETADTLDASTASVNSALQRARKTVEEKLPGESQQQTLRALGDDGVRSVVESYMSAMERGDVDAVATMLAHDAAWSMPPLAAWFTGAEGLRGFLANGPLSGQWRWTHRATVANGQPAIGAYTWREPDGCFVPFALDVLTLDGRPGGRAHPIREVTSFIVRSTGAATPERILRFPDEPPDADKVLATFERFGLPSRVGA